MYRLSLLSWMFSKIFSCQSYLTRNKRPIVSVFLAVILQFWKIAGVHITSQHFLHNPFLVHPVWRRMCGVRYPILFLGFLLLFHLALYCHRRYSLLPINFFVSLFLSLVMIYLIFFLLALYPRAIGSLRWLSPPFNVLPLLSFRFISDIS